jgi:acyl carrier protein
MDKRSKALDVIGRIAGKPSAELVEKDELVADLGIDSPKALQLLIELEDALGVEISDDDAAKMDTVGDILAQVA